MKEPYSYVVHGERFAKPYNGADYILEYNEYFHYKSLFEAVDKYKELITDKDLKLTEVTIYKLDYTYIETWYGKED